MELETVKSALTVPACAALLALTTSRCSVCESLFLGKAATVEAQANVLSNERVDGILDAKVKECGGMY